MTFNAWCAVSGQGFNNDLRFAFEAVWDAMIRRGVSASETSSLLTDLVHALPQPEFVDEDDFV